MAAQAEAVNAAGDPVVTKAQIDSEDLGWQSIMAEERRRPKWGAWVVGTHLEEEIIGLPEDRYAWSWGGRGEVTGP